MFSNEPQVDPEEASISKSHLSFPVVGIGASAGGIGALSNFLSRVADDSGMAFVVVMHLSPDHESMLGEILRRAGKLPVTTVTGATPIEANHVYVISPGHKLQMTDGQLRVSILDTMEGRRQSIDLFFRSLAQAHQERAVSIVLSGTGSDGSLGLRRIKELGGVAFAQSPEDAEFDGMPRAAIQTGLVDFALPVAEIPERLDLLWQNAQRIELPSPPPGLKVEPSSGEFEMLAEEALVSIKALLRERTGHDFAHYKRGTVLRRLERRMQVTGVPDLPTYRRLLDSEPRETPALLQDMLISVTNFFRDPEAFAHLESTLRARLHERPAGEPFRAWVVGCATGEEAYSVAIMLRELIGRLEPAIQVFASDIDQRAVASARLGIFPPAIATDVSAGRLQTFFVEEAGGHRIVKPVRDSVVFSVHNALSDPPFTRMDLICCRNVLIYLDRVAQAQLLKSFHFALKPQGLLFLGSSEATDSVEGLFDGIDKMHRIYQANAIAVRSRVLPPVSTRIPTVPLATARPAAPTPDRPPLEILHERVLRNYAPPTVLVDADDTVLHVSQRASHLLRLPEGAPTNKLMALARPELRPELRAALTRAAKTGLAVEAPRVALVINGRPRTVIMTVRPATDEVPKGLMLVVFDEADESLASGAAGRTQRDPVVDSLEAELMQTQERLRSTVGESAASTEELRSSNEELQTINEELRSTTEELETSREELQAVNEELTTVNVELRLRVDETGKVNDDLQNLMTSADIGAVFVDRDMRLKRFTPQSATLFNLLPTDLGRPLLDITHRLDYAPLAADISDVLRTLKRVEREVSSDDGRWFLARVAPYRTADDRIDGAVLAFFDITSRLKAEESLRRVEQRMASVAESMRDYAIVTMDADGTIATWSAGAQTIFGYEAHEAIGAGFDLLFTPEDRAAGKPAEELRSARAVGRAEDDRWHLRKDGTRIYCVGVTTPLGPAGGLGFAKIARDSTQAELGNQRREAAVAAEQANTGRIREADAMKDEFLAVVSHELKNPLSVIHLNAQLWSRLPGSASDPRAMRSAAIINSAVASQAQLINDLLELSRANMGKIVLEPALLELADVASRVIDAARLDAEAKGQSLEVELDAARVLADPVRIEQVVWNLVSNAVKFTPPGGHIQVRLSVEGAMARLDVADSGIGIEPQHLGQLFEMFRQVQTGVNRTKTGLGIGLALVRQLSELHGGRAEARSDGLGRGSTFTVWLPLAGSAGEKPVQPPVEAGLAGVRLLLVDDDVDLLAAFGALLEAEGAQVTLADGADTALKRVQEGGFDAVVSDISMPGHDGYWLAARLREMDTTRDMRLIAVSGMSRQADRTRAAEAGFDAHLAKPLDMELLRAALFKRVSRAPGD